VKRTYRYDPVSKEMVEVTHVEREQFHYAHGNFAPVMGIDDRGRARRYLKANNLVPYEAPKANPHAQRDAQRERARDVASAFEHTRNQQRARERFG
jgi:hypothetical protein